MAPETQVLDRHEVSRPRSARLHMFSSQDDAFVLDVNSGKIRHLPPERAKTIAMSLDVGDPERAELTAMAFGIVTPEDRGHEVPRAVRVKAISLAVAQKCNLGCSYCYAQQGSFGGTASEMPPEIAQAAIDQLIGAAATGETVTLAFMGGEPLVNRKTLHASTRYAADRAGARGVGIGFTMTTNGTLLRDDDIRLFDEFGFTLSISIDGLKDAHDRQRPFRSGEGSFARLAKNLSALFAVGGRRYRVLARVTVTPDNLDLPHILTELLDMGFDAVMFSPMLSAPSGKSEMTAAHLDLLLDQLATCGNLFRSELKRGRVLPFSNVLQTLQRIHQYQRDEYPCGAGGGYMGVSASGGLYACHRFVDDEDGRMGDVFDGVAPQLQADWLDARNLDKQSPCGTCWARYLCSGSCHYEVIKRGRPACDYIRGWLTYCLELYVELVRDRPDAMRAILAGP